MLGTGWGGVHAAHSSGRDDLHELVGALGYKGAVAAFAQNGCLQSFA